MAKVVAAPGVPAKMGRHGCFLGKLRLLELAALAGDTEFRGWLLQRGANPHLENTWCVSQEHYRHRVFSREPGQGFRSAQPAGP